MGTEIRPVRYSWDVPLGMRGTPFGDLLEYHALGRPHGRHEQSSLLVVTCIDHRVTLRVPDRFAYVLRVGGANPNLADFNVSFAIAARGVRWIALVGHTDCGAVRLAARRDEVVEGLVRGGGWERDRAERHVDVHLVDYDIDDPAAFVLREAAALEAEYPGVRAAAFLYDVADGSLSVVAAAP